MHLSLDVMTFETSCHCKYMGVRSFSPSAEMTGVQILVLSEGQVLYQTPTV